MAIPLAAQRDASNSVARHRNSDPEKNELARGCCPSQQIHMPSVGRSSDSRALAKLAFSPIRPSYWSLKRPVQRSVRQWPLVESFAFSRLQRRGRPGFAPGSLFVGDQNRGHRPPTHV